MKGTSDEIYEQMKNWCESIFKQQNQQLKPSIQAKINTGLKNALQKSKRLSTQSENTSPARGEDKPAIATERNGLFDVPAPALSPRSKSSQREDDLPYAEPIQDQHKDDAIEMLACFGEKATRCLFSNAWAPRVEALSFVQALIETRQLSFENKGSEPQHRALLSAIQKTLLQALQDRVNSVFEAGVALLMEVSIAFDSSVASPTDVAAMHALVRPLIPRLLVKLGDSKSRLHVTTEDALLLLSRQSSCIGPVFLLDEMIACDRSSSPQTLSATYLVNKLGLISKLMLEFGIQESSAGEEGLLPIRNVLQPALQVCEHKDPNVRQMSLQLVSDTLQVARAAAMPFLDALARSSRQKLFSKLVERGVLESDMLMDEVDDFEVSNDPIRPGTSGNIRPPTASASSTKHRPALVNTSLSATGASSGSQPGSSSASQSQAVPLPYGTALTDEQKNLFASIIEGFGEDLVRCLLDKAWAQREAAIREVERQVVCASGRVLSEKALPKTLEALRVLAQVLEIGLNDTVARVFQCALRLFQVISTDFLPLVASEHQYVDEILENVVGLVLQKLGDTKQRLRQDCFTLLHSIASLNHVGHARMCKMLAEKYQELASSSSAIAASPLIIGELLRLFTLFVKEAPVVSTGANQPQKVPQPDLSLILAIIRPALENKHVDVRNAAIATYSTIYEATNGGTNDSYGSIDLNSFLAQTKPSIREAITRSVVQITKTLPTALDTNRPEIDSGRKLQRSLGIDPHKLEQICSPEMTELLTSASSSASQRCLGVDQLIDQFVTLPTNARFKGAWETCCLLAKQLMLESTPSLCLATFELLQLIADPPARSFDGVIAPEYAIPWGEWGVQLVLGSTIRGVVQQSASESVRVRAKVQELLRLIAAKSAVGKHAVCNAILSAPEQSDLSGSVDESLEARKIAITKLRWQLTLRLELLLEFLLVGDTSSSGAPSPMLSGRRRSSSQARKASSSTELLGLASVVPFLGSCVTHPSPLVRTASTKIMRYLHATCEEELAKFVQANCSPALQRRLQTLMAQAARAEDDEGSNNADHFEADRTTCVRGSRASHVRRVAALRPPRSVPVEEKQMVVDVFPPPNSAPGKSRRDSMGVGVDAEDDSMNDGSNLKTRRDNDQAPHGLKQPPIWLGQSPESGLSTRKGSIANGSMRPLSFGDGEPEGSSMGVLVGGGAAGLMKARRKSSLRGNSNNSDDVDERERVRYGVY
ncbi:hypothetical protein BBJ28_00015877 [Nothophytophthora sp. Chile5]|nr:hypothetical protein BBJ28_00015877 [Nothophytophthora sp. Chile5]